MSVGAASRWRRVGGVEWLEHHAGARPVRPDEAAGSLAVDTDRAEVRTVEVGVLFGAAAAAEPATRTGIGAAGLDALAAELARPQELVFGGGGHRVSEIGVRTFNGLASSSLRLIGEPEAVRSGLQRLESLLLDPAPLSVADGGRAFLWPGWWREFTAWFGVGGATLSADQPDPWAGHVAELHAHLAGLHPSRGGRVVAWTSDAELTGAAFGAGVPVPAHPVDWWRRPAPTTSANAVHGSYANNLVTVRVPGTLVHELALEIAARTAHRSLVRIGRLVDELDTIVEPVGFDTLLGMRGMDASDRVDYVEVRRQLIGALDALTDLGDAAILEHIEGAREHGSFATTYDVAARRALLTGRQQTPDELRADLGMLSCGEVRAALATVRAQTLLSVWREEADLPGIRRWRPAELPALTRPYLKRTSSTFVPGRVGSERQDYRSDEHTLELGVRPKTSMGYSGLRTASAIDLGSIAVREDIGSEYTRLVDRDGRMMTVTWPPLLRAAPLRDRIDAATPPDAWLRRVADPIATGELKSTMFKHRLGQVILVLVCLALLIPFLIQKLG